jgi:hypothetical protein
LGSRARRFERLTMQLGIECCFHDLRRTFSSLKVSAGVSIYKVAKWNGHRVEIAELHYGHLVPSDDEIEIGIERRKPAPEVAMPELSGASPTQLGRTARPCLVNADDTSGSLPWHHRHRSAQNVCSTQGSNPKARLLASVTGSA